MHLDLLTTVPNSGVVWFDRIEFERIASNLPEPVAPDLKAETPAGQDGCLEVTWDPATLTDGTVRLIIRCTPAATRPAPESLPKAVVNPDTGKAMLWGLDNGRDYTLAAVAVNGDGKASPPGGATRATPRDRQAPRGGWLLGEPQADVEGGVEAQWWPHVLDEDLAEVHFCAPGDGAGPVAS